MLRLWSGLELQPFTLGATPGRQFLGGSAVGSPGGSSERHFAPDCGVPSMAATLRGAAKAAPKIAPSNFLFFAHRPVSRLLVVRDASLCKSQKLRRPRPSPGSGQRASNNKDATGVVVRNCPNPGDGRRYDSGATFSVAALLAAAPLAGQGRERATIRRAASLRGTALPGKRCLHEAPPTPIRLT